MTIAFGKYIKDERLAHELTLADLAAHSKIKIKASTLRLLEEGFGRPSSYTVRSLAMVLGLSIDYLNYLLGRLPPDRRRDMIVAEVEAAMAAFREQGDD